MNARRNRRRNDGTGKNDPNSGTFQIPAASRVARRGSTRVEPTPLADVAPRSRSGFRAGDS